MTGIESIKLLFNTKKPLLTINTWYPLGWIVLFQVVAIAVFFSNQLQSQLSEAYNYLFWFSSLNRKPPFSSLFGQSCAMAAILLMPIQLVSLFLLSNEEVLATVFPGKYTNASAPGLFFLGCFLILFLFLPLGNNSLVRLLGGGWLAVSILTPLITGMLPISIRLMGVAFQKPKN